MVEKKIIAENTSTSETPTEAHADKKPGLFRRVVNGIKEVPKAIVKVVKGVDKVLMHIPVAGEIYGVAKGVTREVWRASEQIPFLGDVTREVREGAENISDKVGFSQPEKEKIVQSEDALLTSLRQVRENVANQMPDSPIKDDLVALYDEVITHSENGNASTDQMELIFGKFLEKHPEIKPFVQDYLNQLSRMKTGKEAMSVDELVEDGRKLEKQFVELFGKEDNGIKKGELSKEQFDVLRKTFPNLPQFDALKKGSTMYAFFQNVYFSRQPQPDLNNPLVKEYINKTLKLFESHQNESFISVYRDRTDFILSNKESLVSAFHLSDLEKNNLERDINHEEKIRRLPPTLPHEYAGPDYGLSNMHMAMHQKLFPDKYPQNEEQRVLNEKVASHPGVLLDFFVGGGH